MPAPPRIVRRAWRRSISNCPPPSSPGKCLLYRRLRHGNVAAIRVTLGRRQPADLHVCQWLRNIGGSV
jgi:hypothetical protein